MRLSAATRNRRCRSAKAAGRSRSAPRRRRLASITPNPRGCWGLAEVELDQLARDDIIGTEMLMEEQFVKEKKRAAG